MPIAIHFTGQHRRARFESGESHHLVTRTLAIPCAAQGDGTRVLASQRSVGQTQSEYRFQFLLKSNAKTNSRNCLQALSLIATKKKSQTAVLVDMDPCSSYRGTIYRAHFATSGRRSRPRIPPQGSFSICHPGEVAGPFLRLRANAGHAVEGSQQDVMCQTRVLRCAVTASFHHRQKNRQECPSTARSIQPAHGKFLWIAK